MHKKKFHKSPERKKRSTRAQKADQDSRDAGQAFAEGDFEQSVRLNEHAGRIFIKEGEHLHAAQRFHHASVTCGSKLGDVEKQLSYAEKSADNYRKAGMNEEAATEYKVCATLSRTKLEDPNKALASGARFNVKAGECFAEAGNHPEAGNCFRIASIAYGRELKEYPKAVENATRAGECFIKAQMPEDAEKAFQAAEKIATQILNQPKLVREIGERKMKALTGL
ncbi:MAG: hypothetical protein ABH851_02810 [Methanobacteriota archaeon]